ncbi:MAG: OmpA family protein [Bacteroidetes bacterium]|nr:OmpA family protein [Bacteroidota bacterium]MBU1484589.1 OmpA family protein [Bacteroidota bacterium]MBU2267674.1 OmpA family protein [Bacteroidota bacterium]MBU2375983.1 OmpA family protein [Bacteroidota bacterium]
MKTNFQKSIMLLGAIAMSNFALAQDSTPMMSESPAPFTKGAYRTWSFGLNGGVMSPVVATGGRNDFTNWKASLGYGGYIKKQIWHNFGIQGDFFRGTLKANNDKALGNGTKYNSPYSSYQTDVKWVGTLSAVYNIGNFSILDRQSYVSPYVSAGAGLMGYQPTDITTGGQSVMLKSGGNIHELVVPVGVGAKFMIAKGINLDLGYKMNFVDGDNLDGYHREPQNDKFSYGYAGLEFALGNKTKPQLAFANPAAALEKDYVAKYDDLKAQMANMPKGNEDEVNALKDKVNKLMTDTDGDGVSDYYDKCPNTPKGTAVDGAGCPLPKVEPAKPVTYIITDEDKKVVSEAIKNLEFDFNKSTIRSKSYATLNRVAELLISKNLSLKLAGHTDSKGSEAYNMKLSKERAESVKTYLVSKMVNPSRIEATGYGETQPIDTNATEAGRQNNRRVEFTLFN